MGAVYVAIGFLAIAAVLFVFWLTSRSGVTSQPVPPATTSADPAERPGESGVAEEAERWLHTQP